MMLPEVDGASDPFLARLQIMTELDEDEIMAVKGLYGGTRRLAAKAELFPRDERADRLHVLLDGWAMRYRLLADGQRQITMLLLPGDICNLDMLYTQSTEFSVSALTPCTFAILNMHAVREALARPRVAAVFGWLGALENAMLAERNACLGRKSAREHMAQLICELLVRLSVVGRVKDGGFVLPMTQEEIADVIGLTSVHVNRVLQRLRVDDLVRRQGHDIHISDAATLGRVAGFRSDYLHLEGADGAGRALSRVPEALAPKRRRQ